MTPFKTTVLITTILTLAPLAHAQESPELRVLLGLDCLKKEIDNTLSVQRDCAKPVEAKPQKIPGVGRIAPRPIDPPIENLRQVDLDAVDAAGHVYAIFKKAKSVPDSYRVPCLRSYFLPPNLQRLAPKGYKASVMLNDNGKDLDEISKKVTDSKGAFGVLFLPDDRSKPAIFASKGTVTLTDWRNNINRAPIDYIERLYGKTCGTDSFFSYLKKYVQTQGSLVITGHSQGGAIAQIIGRRLQGEVMSASLDTTPASIVNGKLVKGKPNGHPIQPKGHIHIVTFNALGGVKSEELFHARIFGESLAKKMTEHPVPPQNARNYYLKGDPVFPLVPQIGPGIVVPTEKLDEPTLSLSSHSISNVSKAMHADFRALRLKLAKEVLEDIEKIKFHKEAKNKTKGWTRAGHQVEYDKFVDDAKAKAEKIKQIDLFLYASPDGKPLEDLVPPGK